MPAPIRNFFSLTPEIDREQKGIMRRFYIAAGGYAFAFVFVIIPAYVMGFAGNLTVFQILLFFFLPLIACNLCFYVMFLTGMNRYFSDPGLTFWQQLAGIVLATVICYFAVDSIRGAVLILYIHIFYFGTFKNRYRDFFYPLLATVVLYSGMVLLLYHNHPEVVDLKTELMRFLILLTALIWLMWMGRYMARLRSQIQQMAIHDELTGVYNRRQLFALLAREKAMADRSGTPFTVCMMDLDDFKLVNDTYGHQAGDDILREFAAAIQRSIRAEDYLARYGGEEFLVVLANYQCRNPEEETIQRLRRMTESLLFRDLPGFSGITVSIGVSTYQGGESIDMLIARADEALYEAKRKGKNRVALSRKDCPAAGHQPAG